MHCLIKSVAVSAITTLGLVASAAHASGSDPGWYLGAAAGRSELKVEGGSMEQASLSDTAFAVHGGYRITRHVAVEAAYADLGGFDYTATCPTDVCVPEAFPARFDASVKRLDVALLGIVPIGQRIEAYAKLGAGRTEVDRSVSTLSSGRSHSSDSSSDVVYGVGMRAHLDAPWSLHLLWERSADVGDSDADLDALWLGAAYRFAR